jgi:hypothetical protein
MKYGSDAHDRREDAVAAVEIATDRMSVKLKVADFGKGDKWLDRIYHIQLPDTAGLFGDAPVWKALEAYFTLRAIH